MLYTALVDLLFLPCNAVEKPQYAVALFPFRLYRTVKMLSPAIGAPFRSVLSREHTGPRP